jgi:hypothetical protein
MAPFFSFIFGLWMLVAILSSPFFWFKKTDRSQAPIARRLLALGYGLAWPYLLVTQFTGKEQRERDERERRSAQRRIIGDGTPARASAPAARPTPAAPGGQPSGIKNPYDA